MPDLLQRSGLDLAVETETPRDDVAFARVEMAEDSADIGLALGLGAFLFEGVGARVGRGAEKLFVPGAESVELNVFVGDRPGEVLHDRPGGIGAELVAQREVEFLDGAHQGDVAVADQFEEGAGLLDMPLGNRDNEAEVGSNDAVLGGNHLGVQLFDAVHQPHAGARRIELLAELGRFVLEVVHFAEQVRLFLARKQRHFIEALQVGGKPGRNARRDRLRCRRGRLAHDLRDLTLAPHAREDRVGDEVERKLENPLRADFVDHAADHGSGTVESPSEDLDRLAAATLAIDFPLHVRAERPVTVGKDRALRIGAIVILQRVTDGLDASAGFVGKRLGDGCGPGAGLGKLPGALNDAILLLLGQLRKARAATDAIGVFGNESGHVLVGEADPRTPLVGKTARRQAQVAPAGNRLGGHVEPVSQLLDREKIEFLGGSGCRAAGSPQVVTGDRPRQGRRIDAPRGVHFIADHGHGPVFFSLPL